MQVVSSMTTTPAEPAIVPAFRSPSTSIVTSISSARRSGAEEPPGTTAFSAPPVRDAARLLDQRRGA